MKKRHYQIDKNREFIISRPARNTKENILG